MDQPKKYTFNFTIYGEIGGVFFWFSRVLVGSSPESGKAGRAPAGLDNALFSVCSRRLLHDLRPARSVN